MKTQKLICSTKKPKIESEKIDCLHRRCSRPAPRGKIESVCTHSEVIKQFDSFSLLKLLFLVINWHCWSRKAFTRQMTPQSREKLRRRPFFDTADRHGKLYRRLRLYTSPKDATKLAVFFHFFFSSLSFVISMKNSVQSWSSDFQSLFRVKIRKMALGSNDLSTLPLKRYTRWDQAQGEFGEELVCFGVSFEGVVVAAHRPSICHQVLYWLKWEQVLVTVIFINNWLKTPVTNHRCHIFPFSVCFIVSVWTLTSNLHHRTRQRKSTMERFCILQIADTVTYWW